jgi:hypothetical protein
VLTPPVTFAASLDLRGLAIFAPVSGFVANLDWFCSNSEIVLFPALLFLTIRYKMYSQLKFFVFYIVFATAREIALDWLGPSPAISDPSFYPYLYFYWTAAFVLSFLRLFITLEICEKVLRRYPALRLFAWRIMAGLGVALFSWTLYVAIHSFHHLKRFILTFQQTTDISFALLLLTLLGLGAYYRMRIPPLYLAILIGSGIYSSVQVVDSELGRQTINLPNSVFDFAQRLAYIVMLTIWSWAIWRWGKDTTPPPELLSQATYDELSHQIHDRLQELNDKLSDLTRKRRS